MPRILVACEWSGVVTNAFRARGYEAWSCDLLPSQTMDHHLQKDVWWELVANKWDALIAFPPCTYLCSSGLHWNKKDPERKLKTERALDFVKRLLDSPIPYIALENPVGCISTRIRPPDQYVQPHQFGHDASKKTGLWLKNLPRLLPTNNIQPRMVNGRPRWGNQTDSGQNKLGPSVDRAQIRGKTYEGIAKAMAEQWGPVISAGPPGS